MIDITIDINDTKTQNAKSTTNLFKTIFKYLSR